MGDVTEITPVANISSKDHKLKRLADDLEACIDEYRGENVTYEAMIGVLESIKFRLHCEQHDMEID